MKRQICIAFLIIILSIIGLDIVCNRYFLDDFSINQKEKTIKTVADDIEEHADNLQDLDFLTQLQRTCNVQNLSLLITNSSGEQLVSFYTKDEDTSMSVRMKNFIDEDDSDYTSRKYQDTSLNITYLEVCGKFANNDYYTIKTSIDSINESVALSTMFLIYILIIMLPVSIFFILFLIDRLMTPLENLVGASKKIASLDFSTKCEEKGTREVKTLAINFNKMSNELERTISDLKAANKQLQTDLDKKQKLEEQRKDFMSSVSHELKTPIAIISGYAENLQDATDDPKEVAMFADTIYDETQNLSKLVKQILDVNKMQDATPNYSPVCLGEMVEEIISPMYGMIGEKGVKLDINIPDNFYITTDPFMMSQIISNFITNAIDHVNNGGDIKIFVKDDKFFVYNSGSSIPEENMEDIWEKFFKIDKSRNRKFGGTGLGLSIVKTFCDSMNKEYGASNKTEGIEFFVGIKKEDIKK